MRKLQWLFLMIPGFVYCSVNEPMRWEIETGYRNDGLHWHLQDRGDNSALTYSEHFRHLQFWENSLALRVIHRDIALVAQGSYGAFGSGSLKQRYANVPNVSDSPTFYWHPDSWTVAGWGYLGYSVNLTDNRTYKVVLIPLVGYGIDCEHLKTHGTHETSEPSYSMTSSIPCDEHMYWFGPLFGGAFLFQPGGRLQFEIGYAFHRLHVRFFEKRRFGLSISDPVSETSETDKMKVKDKGNLAHSGWMRLDYAISKEWRWGLTGKMQYFASRILDVFVKNQETGVKTSQKFKARWTTISGTMDFSRTF
jgi:hypothetical protein